MKGRLVILLALIATLAAAGVVIGVTYRPERGPEERIAPGMLRVHCRGSPAPIRKTQPEGSGGAWRFDRLHPSGAQERRP